MSGTMMTWQVAAKQVGLKQAGWALMGGVSVAAMLVMTTPAAADGAQEDLGIEEIIVTTQKRAQNLQKIPLAVSSLSSRELDTLNIYNPVDLGDKIPGLNITKTEGYRRIVTIRGVGNESPQNAGSRPGVSFHIDGVFIVDDVSLQADLLDVDHVEVLRGPQGTLFGQNSTGGMINVVTKKPDLEEVSGNASLTIGNYSTANVRGSINVPIASTLAVRFALSHREHEGFTENLAIPGRKLDDENNDTFRTQVLWQPAESFSFLAQWQHFNTNTNGPAQKGTLDLSSSDPRKLSHDLLESFKFSNDIVSGIANWETSVANIKTIVSYQNADLDRRVDTDRTALTANDPAPLPIVGAIDTVGEAPIRQADLRLEQMFEHYTAELNITSVPGDLPVDWILGAFYMNTRVNSKTTSFADFGRDGNPLDMSLPVPVIFFNADLDFVNDDIRRRDSYSFYGQLTWHVTDDLRATGGVRYSRDEVNNDRCSFQCRTGQAAPKKAILNDNAWTGKFSLEGDITDDNLAYASISKGYKPGGGNSTFNDFVTEFYKPEVVYAYEIGSKNRFLNRRIQINASAFYYDYKNFQFLANAAAVFSGGVANIPSVEVKGLELEFSGIISENLRFDGNIALEDSKVKSDTLVIDGIAAEDAATAVLLANGGNPFSQAVTDARATAAKSVKGNNLSKLPHLTLNARLTYARPVEGMGLLTISLDYTHRGRMQARIFNNPAVDVIPSYDMLGLNIRWEPEGSHWTAELIVQNLTNEDAVNSRFTDNFAVSSTSEELLAPRRIMGRLSYSF